MVTATDMTHVHSDALAALVASSGRTKQDVAREAEMAPPQLADLLSARRAGLNPQVRGRLASALGVDVEAITCRCDNRVGNHREVR